MKSSNATSVRTLARKVIRHALLGYLGKPNYVRRLLVLVFPISRSVGDSINVAEVIVADVKGAIGTDGEPNRATMIAATLQPSGDEIAVARRRTTRKRHLN